jgi:hypothetical protein
MPCIFCIAVFALLAGAVTTAVLDQLETRLTAAAAGPVQRTTDTGSVTRFEFTVTPPGLKIPRNAERMVPVAVTVYKQQKRIRIQVLTHDLPRPTAEAVEDYVASAAGLHILHRSDAHTGQQLSASAPTTPQTQPEQASPLTPPLARPPRRLVRRHTRLS